ncbi:subclass B1 metallo-beta-lactamase [uncultured Aquimarina sp.]|uniref:subclass B1 metallo-beta-lactamase n=1 Tax=uncultured Aquimarina sp. TaxID=575652 RepID=UPI002635DD7C|nr:subclass B1 metallo-beta-lactamase [uncultured Aquimarina sp.]
MKKVKKVLLNISNINLSNHIKDTIKLVVIVVLVSILGSCKKTYNPENIQISEDLQMIKLNNHNYIHISYITLKNGATFPCNGFVYLNNNEAYVFDSPATDKATTELISWLRNEQKTTIKGVVFNHFHEDCTKGIEIFKKYDITTIASNNTKKLMIQKGIPEPDQTFDNYLELKLQDKIIINSFFGEAHSEDNIVSYFPEESILFGGCMIKSINAKKGNLTDATINEWSKTVTKIKEAYPNLETIIPGHGTYGDQSLLDYTISLFNTEN